MIIFTAILTNNFRRLAERKARLFLFILLTAGAIAAALFINTKADTIGNIAVVSQKDLALPSNYINITWLEEAPPMSDMVSGKYDAVVLFAQDGTYEIRTIRSDELKQKLDALISNPSGFTADQIASRGFGTNIVGFMIMFTMMQGISMVFMFAEDRERKQIMRIATSPVSFMGYLSAHGFFTFITLLIPIMTMLLFTWLIPSIDIGFGLLTYLFITSLLCLFATSFAMFLVAFMKKGDSANMIGSAVIVLTSILAGSFYSFDKGNKALEIIIKVLPQKAFLSMSGLIEQGCDISRWYGYCLYVAVLIIFFFVAAVMKTRKDYVRN